MVLVKILGAIDLVAAFVFLGLIFGSQLPFQFILFPALLLLVKGLFVISGDVLSAIDVFAALILFVSISFSVFSILLWIPAFLLLAKGVISIV